jgi:hypothetical protein
MHSLHHSRARILFEVACVFGISASCVGAWIQTYSTAMLPAAAVAALYGLVHAFDMVRRGPAVSESVEAAERATDRGDLLKHLDAREPELVAAAAPEFVESPVAEVAETGAKRGRKPRKQAAARATRELAVVEAGLEAEPEVAEIADEPAPEVAEPEPVLHVVDTVPDEPEYVPATPLFEPEPFVRQQRAAFGRKAR